MIITELRIDIPVLGKRTFTFDENIVLIRGENGSGKSVLMSLISTDAITSKFFFGNDTRGLKAKKSLTLTDNGDTYSLASTVTKSSTNCSFVKNGEELCNTGKLTLYRTLVEEYGLKMLPVVDQKTGQFFDLSPVKRKEFIHQRFVNGHSEIEALKETHKNMLKSLRDEMKSLQSSVHECSGIIPLEEHTARKKTADEHLVNTVLLESSKKLLLSYKTRLDSLEPVVVTPLTPDLQVLVVESAKDAYDALMKIRSNLFEESLRLESRRDEKKAFDISLQELAKQKQFVATHEEEEIPEELTDMGEVHRYTRFYKDKKAFDLLPFVDTTVKALETVNHCIRQLEVEVSSNRLDISRMEGKVTTLQGILSGAKKADNQCIKVEGECLEMIEKNVADLLSKIKTSKAYLETSEAELKKRLAEKEKQKVYEDSRNRLSKGRREFKGIHGDWSHLTQESFNLATKLVTTRLSIERFEEESDSLMDISLQSIEDEIENKVQKVSLIDTHLKDVVRQGEILIKRKNILESIIKEENDVARLSEMVSTCSYEEESELLRNSDVQRVIREKSNHRIKAITPLINSLDSSVEILKTENLPSLLSLRKLKRLEEGINEVLNNNFTNSLSLSFEYSKKHLKVRINTPYTAGNVYEELSGYETSIVKLCFALRVSDERNDILRLDEVDGVFDSQNRSLFSSFINNLLRTKETNQVFIITHNSEMDIHNCTEISPVK